MKIRKAEKFNSSENEERVEIRGIKVKRLCYILFVIQTVFFAVSIFCALFTYSKYTAIEKINRKYIEVQDDIYEIKEASDYLTTSCRQYVMTGDISYAKAYFDEKNVTKRRENAVANVHSSLDRTEVVPGYYLDDALEESNELTTTEIHAMAIIFSTYPSETDVPKELTGYPLSENEKVLSPEIRRQNAADMVFGKEYITSKNTIDGLVDSASKNLLAAIRIYDNACTREYHIASNILVSMMVLSALIFTGIVFAMFMLVLNPVDRGISCIENRQPISYGRGYEFNYLARAFNRLRITNLQEQIKLKYTAERDSLTGLLNRNGYNEVIKYYTKSDEAIALLIVDVDKFKEVNDTYGHEAGDIALRRVADLLNESFREKDCIARYGGDEFVVIMTDADGLGRNVISEKLESINETLLAVKEEDGPKVTVSVGVAFSSEGYNDEIFRQADEALYRTKENGRCGYSFYQE